MTATTTQMIKTMKMTTTAVGQGSVPATSTSRTRRALGRMQGSTARTTPLRRASRPRGRARPARRHPNDFVRRLVAQPVRPLARPLPRRQLVRHLVPQLVRLLVNRRRVRSRQPARPLPSRRLARRRLARRRLVPQVHLLARRRCAHQPLVR